MTYKVLIIFGLRQLVVGVSQNSVLGVVARKSFGETITLHQGFVFFGKVGFCGCAAFFLIVAMLSFFEPVGDESA